MTQWGHIMFSHCQNRHLENKADEIQPILLTVCIKNQGRLVDNSRISCVFFSIEFVQADFSVHDSF